MFSTTTSAVFTRSSKIARPRADFRFSVTPFLLEFSRRKNQASSPRLSESAVRPGSPAGGSTLITSAPSHASICVQEGPASYWVRSKPAPPARRCSRGSRSEEHTSELQSHHDLVCRLLLAKKKPRYRLAVKGCF